jgi:hypothetical protein
MMLVPPSARPCSASRTAIFAPRWETSTPPMVFGNIMPSGPDAMTASRSASARPVVSALTRTNRRGRPGSLRAAVMKSPVVLRAASFSPSATESSRSRRRASAPACRLLSSLRALSPGTKSSERIGQAVRLCMKPWRRRSATALIRRLSMVVPTVMY